MNGAVQGVATITASTPVKKAPVAPPRETRPWPTPARRPPTSNTPERLRPTTKNR